MREMLPYSKSCFICGEDNPVGFHLNFYLEGDRVLAHVTIPDHFCGYKGIAHGGIVTSLLDEVMSWASSVLGGERKLYVTVEINVRFKKPVPTGERLELVGKVVGKKRGIVLTESSISKDGDILAYAKGKFFPANTETIRKFKDELRYNGCSAFKGFFDNLFP